MILEKRNWVNGEMLFNKNNVLSMMVGLGLRKVEDVRMGVPK
jgi:hypothetical protein